MIVHDRTWDLLDTADMPRKAFRVFTALLRRVQRGNLVLGATEPRLTQITKVARATLVKSLVAMESAQLLHWDRETLVIRINPMLCWDGRHMDSEEWLDAMLEWDGVEKNRTELIAAQREFICGEAA